MKCSSDGKGLVVLPSKDAVINGVIYRRLHNMPAECKVGELKQQN